MEWNQILAEIQRLGTLPDIAFSLKKIIESKPQVLYFFEHFREI